MREIADAGIGALLDEAAQQIEDLQAELQTLRAGHCEPVAIIGIGCRLPGGIVRFEQYAETLRRGPAQFGSAPVSRWGGAAKEAVQAGICAVEGIDKFDAGFFGLGRGEADALDPQHRLLLTCAWEAMEHAGIPPDPAVGLNGGLFVGQCFDEYAIDMMSSSDTSRIDVFSSLGTSRNMAPARVAAALGLEGPSTTLDASCASSLLAVHLAIQSLRVGECDFALAAGTNAVLSPCVTTAFDRIGVLSRSHSCKPFDESADGYVRGEGCVVLVLKRLRDAGSERILGIIRGSAAGSNGKSAALIAPKGAAQVKTVRRALAQAGLTSAALCFIEAQATANRMGDAIEAAAVQSVIDADGPRVAPLYLSSSKAYFGHLEAAAGVTAVLHALQSLREGILPPHPTLERRSLLLARLRDVEISTKPVVLRRNSDDAPLRAGVSAFGMSGTNVHVVLEEPPRQQDREVDAAFWSTLALSAPNPGALGRTALRMAEFMESAASTPPAATAQACALSRHAFHHRLALPLHPGMTGTEAATLLRDLAARHLSAPPDVAVSSHWTIDGPPPRVDAHEAAQLHGSVLDGNFAALDRALHNAPAGFAGGETAQRLAGALATGTLLGELAACAGEPVTWSWRDGGSVIAAIASGTLNAADLIAHTIAHGALPDLPDNVAAPSALHFAPGHGSSVVESFARFAAAWWESGGVFAGRARSRHPGPYLQLPFYPFDERSYMRATTAPVGVAAPGPGVPADEADVRSRIAQCIERVARSLDLPTGAFGPDTTLSELGLDSIHLMQFVMEVRRELKVNLRIRDFADATSIGAVTDLVLTQVRLQRIVEKTPPTARTADPVLQEWEEIRL